MADPEDVVVPEGVLLEPESDIDWNQAVRDAVKRGLLFQSTSPGPLHQLRALAPLREAEEELMTPGGLAGILYGRRAKEAQAASERGEQLAGVERMARPLSEYRLAGAAPAAAGASLYGSRLREEAMDQALGRLGPRQEALGAMRASRSGGLPIPEHMVRAIGGVPEETWARPRVAAQEGLPAFTLRETSGLAITPEQKAAKARDLAAVMLEADPRFGENTGWAKRAAKALYNAKFGDMFPWQEELRFRSQDPLENIVGERGEKMGPLGAEKRAGLHGDYVRTGDRAFVWPGTRPGGPGVGEEGFLDPRTKPGRTPHYAGPATLGEPQSRNIQMGTGRLRYGYGSPHGREYNPASGEEVLRSLDEAFEDYLRLNPAERQNPNAHWDWVEQHREHRGGRAAYPPYQGTGDEHAYWRRLRTVGEKPTPRSWFAGSPHGRFEEWTDDLYPEFRKERGRFSEGKRVRPSQTGRLIPMTVEELLPTVLSRGSRSIAADRWLEKERGPSFASPFGDSMRRAERDYPYSWQSGRTVVPTEEYIPLPPGDETRQVTRAQEHRRMGRLLQTPPLRAWTDHGVPPQGVHRYGGMHAATGGRYNLTGRALEERQNELVRRLSPDELRFEGAIGGGTRPIDRQRTGAERLGRMFPELRSTPGWAEEPGGRRPTPEDRLAMLEDVSRGYSTPGEGGRLNIRGVLGGPEGLYPEESKFLADMIADERKIIEGRAGAFEASQAAEESLGEAVRGAQETVSKARRFPLARALPRLALGLGRDMGLAGLVGGGSVALSGALAEPPTTGRFTPPGPGYVPEGAERASMGDINRIIDERAAEKERMRQLYASEARRAYGEELVPAGIRWADLEQLLGRSLQAP